MVAVVDERRVGLHLARVDAEDGDAAGERVGDGLEDERGDLGVGLDRRALLGRARDTLDDEVEQGVRAQVLRGDAAGDRVDLVARDGVLQRGGDVRRGNLLAAEVALHQGLVRLDDGVEQLRPVLLDDLGHLAGDRDGIFLARARRIHVRAVVQQVDDAGQLVLAADRQLDRDAAVGELLLHRREHTVEVGALAVEHVHEHDARQLEIFRARPHTGGVHLDAHHPGDDDQRALDDSQRGDRVGGEARVARRVDEVDLAALPLEVHERGRERHLPALLVLVPVGDRRAGLDRAQPVRLSRLEEQSLDERGLARPAVADDGDVADLPGFDGHRVLLALVGGCRRQSYAGTRSVAKRAHAAISVAEIAMPASAANHGSRRSVPARSPCSVANAQTASVR